MINTDGGEPERLNRRTSRRLVGVLGDAEVAATKRKCLVATSCRPGTFVRNADALTFLLHTGRSSVITILSAARLASGSHFLDFKAR